jgi:hypothetical protein
MFQHKISHDVGDEERPHKLIFDWVGVKALRTHLGQLLGIAEYLKPAAV